jgi:RNA polymerase sigma-70 factor (ECF subfamily)
VRPAARRNLLEGRLSKVKGRREAKLSNGSAEPGQARPSAGEARRAPFAQVISHNYERIYNVIFRLVDDEDEAADLTQDTFVAAFRAYDRFRQEASPYTWLYRIAVNLTKNRFEKQQRTETRHAFSLDAPMHLEEDEVDRQVEDWALSPERVAENRQLRQFLLSEVAQLKYEYREVVVLRDLAGLRYREMAEVLGCSVEAVKSRLFRARTVLRERIEAFVGDVP